MDTNVKKTENAQTNQIPVFTGLQTYRLNDACEVSFNPTDSGFVKRLYTAFDELKAKYDAHIYRGGRGEKRQRGAVRRQ